MRLRMSAPPRDNEQLLALALRRTARPPARLAVGANKLLICSCVRAPPPHVPIPASSPTHSLTSRLCSSSKPEGRQSKNSEHSWQGCGRIGSSTTSPSPFFLFRLVAFRQFSSKITLWLWSDARTNAHAQTHTLTHQRAGPPRAPIFGWSEQMQRRATKPPRSGPINRVGLTTNSIARTPSANCWCSHAERAMGP